MLNSHSHLPPEENFFLFMWEPWIFDRLHIWKNKEKSKSTTRLSRLVSNAWNLKRKRARQRDHRRTMHTETPYTPPSVASLSKVSVDRNQRYQSTLRPINRRRCIDCRKPGAGALGVNFDLRLHLRVAPLSSFTSISPDIFVNSLYHQLSRICKPEIQSVKDSRYKFSARISLEIDKVTRRKV